MINLIQNTIGALSRRLGIVTKNLQMWLGFTKADVVGGEQLVLDKSTNSNNAKLFTGKALEFNGNDKVDLGTTFGLTGEFTVAFWVNLTNYTQAVIVGDSANQDWFRINSATQYTLKINNSSSINIVSGGSIPLSYWSRIALIRDSNNLVTLSINGIIYTNNAPTKSGDFDFTLIGSKSGTFINGLLSNVQIYNKAWVSDDAAFDYANPNNLVFNNSASSISVSNLKGYYALSEGSGSIAYDSSGQGNNGTITGATYDDQQPTIPQLGMMDWSKGSNLIEYSEDLTNSFYLISNLETVTKSSTLAPSNIGYGYNITPNSNASSHYFDFSYTQITVNVGVEIIYSIFVKPNGNDFIQIATSTGFASKYQNFELTGSGIVGAGSVNGKSIEKIDDWYRISITQTSTGVNPRFLLISSPAVLATRNASFTGNSTDGVLGVGVQINEGTLGSYIGTVGSAASNATLIQNPNDLGKDVLGNSLRLREGGFNLDGSGYAEVATLDLTSTDEITISVWLKTVSNDVSMVLEHSINSNNNNSFYLVINDNSKDFKIADHNSGNNIKEYDGGMSGWKQFTFTVDRSLGVDEITGYVNAVDSFSSTGNNADNNGVFGTYPLYIGSRAGTSLFLDAIIDEVLIYDRALSAKEITNNFNATKSKHQN